MSGVRFLLDTNFIIGMLKGDPAIADLVQERGMVLAECAYSSITRMELLGYSGITGEHEHAITDLLSVLTYLAITPEVEAKTIRLRRTLKLKLPDAIILATAKVHGLELLTLDQDLAAAGC